MGPLVLMAAMSQLVQLVLKAHNGGLELVQLVLKAHDGGLELVQLVLVVVVSLVGQGSFLGRYFSVSTIDCVEVQGVALKLVLEQAGHSVYFTQYTWSRYWWLLSICNGPADVGPWGAIGHVIRVGSP